MCVLRVLSSRFLNIQYYFYCLFSSLTKYSFQFARVDIASYTTLDQFGKLFYSEQINRNFTLKISPFLHSSSCDVGFQNISMNCLPQFLLGPFLSFNWFSFRYSYLICGKRGDNKSKQQSINLHFLSIFLFCCLICWIKKWLHKVTTANYDVMDNRLHSDTQFNGFQLNKRVCFQYFFAICENGFA